MSLADRVLVVNPETGATQREFALVIGAGIDHVAPALRPIVHDTDSYLQCAC